MILSRQSLGLLTVVLILAVLAGGALVRLQGTDTEDDGSGDGARVAGEVTGDAADDAADASGTSASSAFSTEIPQSVTGSAVRRDTLWITVTADGQAAAFREATLTARVAGVVMDVTARENDPVGQGRALVRIDSTEYLLAVQRAESDLRNAEAQFRQRVLFDDEIQDPEVRAQRERLARSISGMDQAEVSLAEARLALERTLVPAPFAGRVADLQVVAGQYVAQGDPLLTVVDLDPIKVEAQVLEADLGLIEAGRAATVTFTALPSERFEGRVETINPIVDPETGTARVTLYLPNPRGRIRPGMYARVALAAQNFADRVLVPRTAILERDRRTMLFVAEEANGVLRAKWRYVTTGRENATDVEILASDETSMVEPGEIVLVDGHHYLVHDAAIRLIDPEEGARGGSGG